MASMYNKGKTPEGRKGATGAMIAGVADNCQINIGQANVQPVLRLSASHVAEREGHRMGCLQDLRADLMRIYSG